MNAHITEFLERVRPFLVAEAFFEWNAAPES